MALIMVLLSDMQWPQIVEAFNRVPFWSALLLLGLYLFAQILSTLRWRLICISLQLPSNWLYLLKLYFLGMFCNLFLPTGVGGDAVKSYALGKTGNSQLKAAHSVLFDRLSGLIAMLMLAMVALTMIRLQPVWIPILIAAMALVGLAALFFAPMIIALMARYLPKIAGYFTPLVSLYKNRLRFYLLFLLAFTIQTLGFIIVIALGEALGIRVSPAFYVVSWTAITLLTLLPISINGIGVREAGFVYLFKLQGVPAEAAMTLGILMFAIPVCASLFGVIPLLQSGLRTEKRLLSP